MILHHIFHGKVITWTLLGALNSLMCVPGIDDTIFCCYYAFWSHYGANIFSTFSSAQLLLVGGVHLASKAEPRLRRLQPRRRRLRRANNVADTVVVAGSVTPAAAKLQHGGLVPTPTGLHGHQSPGVEALLKSIPTGSTTKPHQ